MMFTTRTTPDKCLICNSQEGFKITPNILNQTDNIECEICGRYKVTYEFERALQTKLEKNKNSLICSSMLYAQLLSKNSNVIPYFSDGDIEEKDIESYNYWTMELLENFVPNKFSDRIDKVLWGLSVLYPKYGYKISIKDNMNLLSKLCFLTMDDNSEDELQSFINLLHEMGYIIFNGEHHHDFVLSPNAWIRIDKLQSTNTLKKQGFIAMWFDESMKLAKEKIKAAILANNYTPVIIDEKEHNNQIVPEIFYEIKESDFVIADLTGQRNGVYYEAGYAEALGKQVILTCKQDSTQKTHFDVAQKNTIFWEDEDDLYNRLKSRIEATINLSLEIKNKL